MLKPRALLSASVGVRGLAWAATSKVVSTLFLALIAALLARVSNPDRFGTYFLSLTLVAALTLIVGLGLSQHSLARVARADALRQHDEVRRLIRTSVLAVTLSSVTVAAVLSVPPVSQWMADVTNLQDLEGAGLGLGGLLVSKVLQTQVSQLQRGLKRFRAAETSGGLLSNALFAAFLAVSLHAGSSPTLNVLLLVTATTTLIPTSLGLIDLGRVTHRKQDSGATGDGVSQRTPIRTAVLESWEIIVHSTCLFAVRQLDIVMVAFLAGPTATGLYAGATRICNVVSHPLSAVNSVVSTYIAALWKTDGHRRLQAILSVSATVSALPVIAFAVPVLIFPDAFLTYFLGTEYGAASTILRWLMFGQIINVLFGSCGVTLIMTGHQRVLAVISMSTAVFTLTLGLLLGIAWQSAGIAAAFAVGLSFQNFAMWHAGRRLLDLSTEVNVFATYRVLRSELRGASERGSRPSRPTP